MASVDLLSSDWDAGQTIECHVRRSEPFRYTPDTFVTSAVVAAD